MSFFFQIRIFNTPLTQDFVKIRIFMEINKIRKIKKTAKRFTYNLVIVNTTVSNNNVKTRENNSINGCLQYQFLFNQKSN
jgi:hypothetical protein